MDAKQDAREGQLASFQRIWKGGYFGGDPRHPTLAPEYGAISLISSNHAVYKSLIVPNIKPGARVLEIGPGRGAWTRTFTDAAEVFVFDALSAEHNSFWEYVGEENKARIKYFQVVDASLSDAPEDYFDFVFSFGAFCHMPRDVQFDYYTNAFSKARPGAVGVIMFSDFDKYNAGWRSLPLTRSMAVTLPGIKAFLRFYAGRLLSIFRNSERYLDKNDSTKRPGRFYHVGIEEAAEHLQSVGWKILSRDIDLNLRDPIVVFQKPDAG